MDKNMNKTIITIIILIVVFLIINIIVQNKEPMTSGIQEEKAIQTIYVDDPWCLEHECKG